MKEDVNDAAVFIRLFLSGIGFLLVADVKLLEADNVRPFHYQKQPQGVALLRVNDTPPLPLSLHSRIYLSSICPSHRKALNSDALPILGQISSVD